MYDECTVVINGVVHTRLEDEQGNITYFHNGVRHRQDNGPAFLSHNKNFCWYKEGRRHRDNGPAIEYATGTKKWYKDGQRHREDGPAIELEDGYKEWWICGVEYSEREFNYQIRKLNEQRNKESNFESV